MKIKILCKTFHGL